MTVLVSPPAQPAGRVLDAVLGIDAGNTKTIALIVGRGGEVLGWGRAGPSNIYVSRPLALAAIERAVAQAREVAGLSAHRLQAVTLSATGADWPEDFELLRAALREWDWAPRQGVVNDAVGALRAGTLDGLGVAVVCGTSSGTAARAAGQDAWHSSYWQEPEGAEELARLAVRAVYRAHLGIDPPTTLTARVLAELGCPDVDALLHRLNARTVRKPRKLGRLAKGLLDEAHAGDPTSRRIVRKHGAALGDYALVAARRAGLSGGYQLVTSGGVMRHPSPLLRQALVEQVQGAHPGVTWQPSRLEPVYGAALLGLELAGASVTEEHFGRLAQGGPSATLFLS